MQQCREPYLPVLLLGCLAHTFQPAWPAFPARCPVLVRLFRVLFGQRPSLHTPRRRSPVLVRLLRRYYAAVRLPRAEAKSHRACGSYRSSLSPTGPPPSGLRAATGSLGSRAWSFYACLGSQNPAGRSALASFRTLRLVLPASRTPSAPCICDFGAQYPACIYPCRPLGDLEIVQFLQQAADS